MFKFKHPFTCICSGPTGSGKTTFVQNVLKYNMIQPPSEKIVWLGTPITMEGVEFHSDIPDDIEDKFNSEDNNLLIIDDLMTQCHSDERMTRLFSVGSHHKNLSIVFIIHNLFHQGREMRNMGLNSHYIILLKNPRDSQQIATLARQIYPADWRFLVEAYEEATSEPHGYLVLDLKPDTPDMLRIRTAIFPHESQIVYINKNTSVKNKSFVIETDM